MRYSLRRTGIALALALAACAKQSPLPKASFVGIDQGGLTIATGQQIILDATSSTDPSGGPLSFEWTFSKLPAGSRAKIESPHNAKTRFTADVPTTVTEKYVVSLVVRNQYYPSVPALLTIEALDCGANVPQVNSITAAPTSINISTPVLLTAAVDDKDNGAECQASLKNVKQAEKYFWQLTALPAGSKARLRDPAAVLASFLPDVPGTYTATLTVTDSTGRRSDPGHVDVQVTPCGGATPSINSVTHAPASPTLGQPTQLSADVTDPDNSTVCGLKQGFSFAWVVTGLPRGSSAELNDPAAVNPSFRPDVSGDYTFHLVATDPTGLSATSAPHTITVGCGGAPPIPIVQFTPASAGIGLPVSLKVTPQDADAACGISETFTYAWSLVSIPGGSSARIVAPEASVASLVPDVGGDYAINVTITDSSETRASALTHLTVAGCGNNPPAIDALTALPLNPLISQGVHVTALVSDADSSCAGFDATQAYRWTLVERPAGSAAAIKDPNSRTADFTPDVIGSYQAQLVVTDATGLASTPAVIKVDTSTCGSSQPQIAGVGTSNPSPDPGAAFTLFAQTFDPDNGIGCNLAQGLSLRWAVTSRPAGSSATLSDPSAPRPTFAADVPGAYQFSAVVTDSTGLSSLPSFLTVTTTSCGTAIPTVTALPAGVTVQPFQAVNLSATPFSANTGCGINETFTYRWKIVSAPSDSGAMLSDPAAAAPTFSPDLAGSFLIAVTVTDSHAHVSPEAFVTVTATACTALPPMAGTLTSSPVSPLLGSQVTLAAPSARSTACFAAGTSAAVQYDWSLSKPANSAATLDNPAAQFAKFTPDVAGAYQAMLVVRDAHGVPSTPAVINLNVAPCGTSNLAWNAAPELNPALTEPDGSSPAATLTGGVWTGAFVGTSVTMSAGFVDPPGCGSVTVQPYAYQWALVSRPSGSTAHLDSSNAVHPALVPDLSGDYQVAARVADATGAVLPTRFATFHVPTCGSNSPVVGITAPGSITLSTFESLHLTVQNGSASDADTVTSSCPARFAAGVLPFSYAWTVSPGGAALSSPIGAATDFSAGSPGTYTVQLVASTAKGLQSAPATIVLTVGACGSHPPTIASVTTKVGGALTSRPSVGQAVTVTAVASDPDIGVCGDSIAAYKWTLLSAPAGSLNAVSPGPGASFNVTPDVAGRYAYSVIAIDFFGLESAPYTVSVDTATCAPSIAAATASNPAPSINQPVTLTASLPGDVCVAQPSFAYAWAIVSAPAGSRAVLSSTAGRSVDFTADVAGAYQFSVFATDQAGFSSAPAAVQITAGTCGSNRPRLDPIAAADVSDGTVPAGQFNAGDSVKLSSALTDLNTSCGALTQPYHWQWNLLSRPPGSGATLASGDPTPAFVPDVPGSYQVSGQVTDALGNVSLPVFATLKTTDCGAHPVTASITPSPAPAPQLAATVNMPLQLTANLSDLDQTACPVRFNVALTAEWTVLTAPAGAHASLTATSTSPTSFTSDLPGTYVVGLVGIASNGLRSPRATVSINASRCGANRPAVVSVSTATSHPQVGVATTVTANAFDEDNGAACQASLGALQTFTYAWRAVSLPAGASVDTSTTSKTLPFTPGIAGNYLFEVVATDSAGFSSAPFDVSVVTAGCGPTLGTISATGNSVGSSVSVSLSSATDTCVTSPGTLHYFWSIASRPATSSAAFANPALTSNSFVPDVPGTYGVQVSVTDAGGFSSIADTLVTAGGCSAGPAVSINAPRTFFGGLDVTPAVDRDDGVALSATVTGGGCGAAAPIYSYEWSIFTRPAGSTAQLSDSTSPVPGFVADVPGGTWQVMLIVRDQLGNASTAAVRSVTSSDCGARAPVISAVPSTLNINTFQTQSFTPTAPDPDAACPVRFKDTPISLAWSVRSQPAGAPAPTLAANGDFTPNFPGPYQVQVVATGKDGISSAPAKVSITAAQCGYNAPAIGLITASQASMGLSSTDVTPSTLDARVPIAFSTASFTDLDDTCGAGTIPAQSRTLTWTVTAVPPGSTATIAPGQAQLFPDLPGTYKVLATGTDSNGLSTTRLITFSVSATCGTHAPSAGALTASQPLPSGLPTIHSAPFALGQPVLVDPPTITDADTGCGFGTTYGYAWTMVPAPGSNARLSRADTATPSFVPDRTGPYTLTLTLTDSTSLSSQSTLVLDVECGAAAPVAASFTATQTIESLNTNAGPVSGFTIVQSTAAASVKNGNVPFYPDAPIGLSAPFTDADASCQVSQVAYSWSLARAPAGSAAVILNPTSATPSLVPDLLGNYDVQLTLTDSTGRSSTQIFAGFVGVGNCGIQTPQANIAVTTPLAVAAPVAQLSVPIGSAVLLDGTPSHDGDFDQLQLTSANTPPGAAGTENGCGLTGSLSYQWTVTAAPGPLQPFSVTHADLPNPSFTAPIAGNYDLTLSVSDGTRTGSAPISIHARGIGSSTVTATPANGSFVVGPANGANIITTVLDTDGNPLSAVPVSVSVIAGFTSNTLAPTSGSTGTDGKFTALLTSTKAGNFSPAKTKNGETKTVRASTGGPTVLGSASVDFAPGAVHDIFWFVQPCDTPTGNVIKCGPLLQFPEVDGEDQFGNVVTAYVTAVDLTVTTQPSGSNVNGTLTQNAGTPFDDLSVDTNGIYQLSALSGTLPSVLSNTFQGTPAPPNPPVITSSTATTARKILVSWTGSKNNAGHNDHNVTQYHVFRATGVVTPPDLAFADVGTVPSTGGSASSGTGCGSYSPCGFLDSGLSDGTQYTYYVEADTTTNTTCTSACSNPSNTTSQFTVPATVTNLAATTTAQKTIVLTWTAPTGISTFDVLRSSGGPFNTFSGSSGLSGSTTTFTDTDTGKTANTQYFYEIQSNITGATSPAHNPAPSVSAQANSFTLPDAVSGFSANPIRYNSVTVNWNAVSGTAPVSYTITREDPTPGSPSLATDSGLSGTSFIDTSVYPNVNSYNYRIQAVNGSGSGPLSGVVAATTPAAPWVGANSALSGGWLNSLAVDPNGIVYGTTGKLGDASSSGGIFKLSGANWTPVNNGIPNGVATTSIAIGGITTAVLYAATSGAGVFTSLDDGLTWNPLPTSGLTNQNLRTVFIDLNGTLWAGGDSTGGGGIFSLAFEATAWTTSLAGPTQTVQAFVEDPAPGTGNLWAQLGGGNAATPQGGLYVFSGAAWTRDTTLSTAPADCSLTRANASSLAIDTFGVSPVTPAKLYWGSELCGLLSRTSTGTTWSQVAGYTATEITHVAVFDSGAGKQPFIWVASAEASAANGVTFIENPGPTAVRMSNPSFSNNWEPTALAIDPNAPNRLYAGAGDGSGAYVSSTATAGAGGTFNKTNSGLTNLKVSFLIRDLSSTSNVFAAGDQFGVASSTNAGGSWSAQVPPGCTGSIASLAYDSGSTRLFATCQGVTGIFVGSFAAATNTVTWGASPSSCTGLTSNNFSSGTFVDSSTNPDTLYIATQGAPATIWTTAASGGSIANTCTALTPALPAAVTNVTAIAVDGNGSIYAGSAGNFVNTLCTTTACKTANAPWVAPLAGPKSTARFFIDTRPSPNRIYASGQGTGVGGVWSGAIDTIGAGTTIAWTTVPATPTLVTSNSTVTAFNGFVTSGAPFLFAGTAFTTSQQYANIFRNSGAAWSASGDGIIGGNLTSLTIPSASSIGAANVLAGTTGAGIFKTTTGGQ